MGDPRFSVLLACYGHERFLEGAVRSIWKQAADSTEIVAVDDGSPDRTGELLDSLAAQSPVPMTVLHTPNGGAHHAFNVAANSARGTFLSFLNDDDEYADDRLEVFGRIIDRSPSFQWGFSAVATIDGSGAPIPPSSILDSRRAAVELSARPIEAMRLFPSVNTAVSSGNLIVRTALFHQLGDYRPFRYIHDWDLGLRLYWEAEPMISERPLYFYRIHSTNTFETSAAAGEVVTMREFHCETMLSGGLIWDRRTGERGGIAAERDLAVVQRDEALGQLQSVLMSRTWRYTHWYRALRGMLRKT